MLWVCGLCQGGKKREWGEDAGLREWGEAVESQGEENKNKNPADQGSQFSIF